MLIPRDRKSKKHLWKSLACTLAGAGFFAVKTLVKDKNAADFLYILGWASIFFGVWFYLKSLSYTLDMSVKPAFKRAYDRIAKSVKKAVLKIKKRLGIADSKWRMKGTDSLSFVFPSRKKNKVEKRDFGKSRIKWNEDPGNPWKIRYIYTKYIVKRAKKGAYIKSSATPFENGEMLGKSCAYPEIFGLYTLSRYAPPEISNSEVSDDMVEEAREKLGK